MSALTSHGDLQSRPMPRRQIQSQVKLQFRIGLHRPGERHLQEFHQK